MLSGKELKPIPPLDAGHRQHDALSFDLHEALCQKLRGNPQLIEKLREENDARLGMESLRDSRGYFEAWREAIDAGVDAVIALALEKSDRGQVMRTSSPFVAIADQEWRLDFLREWRKKYRTHDDILRHPLFERRND